MLDEVAVTPGVVGHAGTHPGLVGEVGSCFRDWASRKVSQVALGRRGRPGTSPRSNSRRCGWPSLPRSGTRSSTSAPNPGKPPGRSTGSRRAVSGKGGLAITGLARAMRRRSVSIGRHGIGGGGADPGGSSLWASAAVTRVLCVTHLPQIAAHTTGTTGSPARTDGRRYGDSAARQGGRIVEALAAAGGSQAGRKFSRERARGSIEPKLARRCRSRRLRAAHDGVADCHRRLLTYLHANAAWRRPIRAYRADLATSCGPWVSRSGPPRRSVDRYRCQNPTGQRNTPVFAQQLHGGSLAPRGSSGLPTAKA